MKSCKTCDDCRPKPLPGFRGLGYRCRRHTAAGGEEIPCFRDDEGGPPDGCHSDTRQLNTDTAPE